MLPTNYATGYQGNANPNYPVSVAEGAQLSSIITCGGFVLVGLLLPAALTSTALTFEASVDGESFFPVYDADTGDAVSYTVTEGTYLAINPEYFYGINYLKLKFGTDEAAARTLSASLRGF